MEDVIDFFLEGRTMRQFLKVMNIFLCLIFLHISCSGMDHNVSESTMSELERLQKTASLCAFLDGDTQLHVWARLSNVEKFRNFVCACKATGYKVNISPQRYLHSDEGLWVVCETPLSIAQKLQKVDLENQLRYQAIIEIIEEYKTEQSTLYLLSKL